MCIYTHPPVTTLPRYPRPSEHKRHSRITLPETMIERQCVACCNILPGYYFQCFCHPGMVPIYWGTCESISRASLTIGTANTVVIGPSYSMDYVPISSINTSIILCNICSIKLFYYQLKYILLLYRFINTLNCLEYLPCRSWNLSCSWCWLYWWSVWRPHTLLPTR